MDAISVKILRFVDQSQPGWVECALIDANGQEWRFVDKVPIFTSDFLDEHSFYPQAGVIACKVVDSWKTTNGLEVVRVDTSEPWAIEASNGRTTFNVFRDQMKTI